MSGKNLVFTLNNPLYDYDDLMCCIESMAGFVFLIFQEEKGAEGTPHYQGYVEFSNTVRFVTIKNAISDNRIHLERRRGTREQAIAYASKLDTRIRGPWESGMRTRPGQGARSDLADLVELAKTGPTLKALVEAGGTTFTRYSRGISLIRSLYLDKPRLPPVVVLCYGPPGTGKTRLIYDNFPHEQIYRKICTDQFFDGYEGQDVLLLDDFAGRASKMALTDLLGILDRYPYRLPVKGSSQPLTSTKIFLTTNMHPKLWYDYTNRSGEWRCVMRRINQVVWFKTPTVSKHLSVSEFFEDWSEGCDEETVFRPLLFSPSFAQADPSPPNTQPPDTPPSNQEAQDMSDPL